FAIPAASASAAGFAECSVPLDNFDRGNSIGLGSNWTVRANQMNIESNSATNPEATPGLATWNSLVPTQQGCAQGSDHGPGGQYAAIVLGYMDNTNNAFIKVQHNSSTGFDTVFMYYGNNGTCQITGGCSFPITTAFHSARLHASLDTNTGVATLEIDS